jgi:hypothetical protein
MRIQGGTSNAKINHDAGNAKPRSRLSDDVPKGITVLVSIPGHHRIGRPLQP